MSVRFKNDAGLQTALNTIVGSGQAKASFAFRFRLNTPPDYPAGNLLYNLVGKDFMFTSTLFQASAGSQTPKILASWGQSGGATQNVTPTVNTNLVYAIAGTYDKDDPTAQAIYLDGVKYPMNVGLTGVLNSSNSAFKIGTVSNSTFPPRDDEVEGLAWWNGYVLTIDDVLALMYGADPLAIGAGASWRGSWPLVGTPGAVPAAGDSGLANAADGSLPFTPFVSATTAGSELTYGPPMPFVSQVAYETPVVCSSGKAIRVASTLASTGAPLYVTAGSATIMPTIRVNGGAPITLERPFYSATHYGIMYFLPSGQKVPKDASVTFSVADDWFATSVGVASGAADMAIVNRSGKTLYGDGAALMRVGYNYTGPASRYWGYEQAIKNYANRLGVDNVSPGMPSQRADGTLSSNWSGLLVQTSVANSVDRTGTPLKLGKWALAYDDVDEAHPVDWSLYLGSGAGTVTELTAYRNDGDASGVGKARVYDVQRSTLNFTLPAGCDAAQTTITLNSTTGILQAGSNGLANMWIKVDDEYMDIMSYNATTKTITVARGVLGSTAAAHAPGSVALVSYYNLYPAIYAKVNASNGTPNYANLAIFGPGDWDVPTTPGPIVLDRSPSNMKGVGRFILDGMANGVGVCRFMDSTMTFTCAGEPEDMRLDSDPYWGGTVKRTVSIQFATGRNLNPTDAPYFYYPYAVQNGEKYAATLGANITTAPAAGTHEVITIPDAATAPVFYGLRLFLPSGEILRVVDVAGTQVTVARGAGGTTPAVCAAGPIQAGWRVPHASSAQYDRPNSAAVEWITSAPHKMLPGSWISSSSLTDLNTLARISVTLTADVDASATTLSVSAAAGDWMYIAPGLHILFGSEEVRVKTVNQVAGTITVDRAYAGTAASHASGTVGTGRSNSVFCVSADGTQYAWHDQAGFREQYQVTGPNSLMSTCYVPIGQACNAVGSQPMDTTPVISGGVDKTYIGFNIPGSSYSYEHTARITAQSPGAYHWLNIPYCATDDLVIALARSIRDTLPAGAHHVVVELANEVWNFPAFSFQDSIIKASLIQGYSGNFDSWVVRTGAVAALVRSVFQEQGRGSEVLTALPFQGGGVGTILPRAAALNVLVDVASTAPYTSPDPGQPQVDAFTYSDDDQCNDAWLFELEYNNKGAGANLRYDKQAVDDYRTHYNPDVQFIHYEGGRESSVPRPTALIPYGDARNVDLVYNPTAYFTEYDYFYVINRIGGSDGIALFDHCQTLAGPLNMTGGHWYATWGVTEYDGQQAGYGDGSDGKADNRLCLATPGKPGSKHPTVNQAENVVSVRRQANLDYNAAYAAYQAGNPGDGGGPGGNPPPSDSTAGYSHEQYLRPFHKRRYRSSGSRRR